MDPVHEDTHIVLLEVYVAKCVLDVWNKIANGVLCGVVHKHYKGIL